MSISEARLIGLERFSMPHNAPDPLASYQCARHMEEGSLHVTKTVLEKEHRADQKHLCESKKRQWLDDQSEEDDSGTGDEDCDDHPNLRMKWRWTELSR